MSIFDRPLETTPKLVLEANKVMSKTRMGAYMRRHLIISEHEEQGWIERTAYDLVYSLETYVLTQKTAPETYTIRFEVEVPDGWFQALKAQRMRDWILRRWPVRTRSITQSRTVTHKREAMFPEANILPPELGKPVVFDWWEGRV